MWQFLNQIFMSKLLVSILWVDHNSLHLTISPEFLELFNLLFLNLFSLLDSLKMLGIIYTWPCPLIPSLLDFWHLDLLSKILFDFLLFFLFELFQNSVLIFSHKQVLETWSTVVNDLFAFSIEFWQIILLYGSWFTAFFALLFLSNFFRLWFFFLYLWLWGWLLLLISN